MTLSTAVVQPVEFHEWRALDFPFRWRYGTISSLLYHKLIRNDLVQADGRDVSTSHRGDTVHTPIR